MTKKIVNFLADEKLKFISIITTIFMFAAHGYVYLNTIFSHDSMKIIYWGESLLYDTVEIGRYIIPPYLIFRGKYYPPFLIGLLSIVFMILFIYFLVSLFDIKSKVNIGFLSGIISTSCVITLLNATYIEYSDMYILSFLLATISLYILLKTKIKFKIPISIILFIVSMGIYQTSFPIFLVLLFIYIIIDILKNDNFKDSFKKLFINTSICGIASVIYFIIYKVILKVCKFNASTCYNSVNEVANYNSIKDMILMVKEQYKKTFEFIMHPSTYYKNIVFYLNMFLIIITIYMIIKVIVKKKHSILSKLLLIVLIIGLTFIVNCTFFLANGVIHQLMIIPMYLLYILLIVLIDRGEDDKSFVCIKNTSNRLSKLVIASFVIMLFSSIIYSNQVYLKKHMEFETTKLTMNRIIQNIENMDEFDVRNTPIVFIGYLHKGQLSEHKKELDYESVGLGETYSLTYYLNYMQFFNNYLGYPVKVLDEKKSLEYAEKEEVKEMKSFPTKEYYKIIDGVLVIKLSD